jgi:hypothetical protein
MSGATTADAIPDLATENDGGEYAIRVAREVLARSRMQDVVEDSVRVA